MFKVERLQVRFEADESRVITRPFFPGGETRISAIIDRVNFDRGRLRPNFGLDLSIGVKLWERDHKSVSFQFDVINVTDRNRDVFFLALRCGLALR